ncbi:hypothetical protein MIMGU_mgv1a0155441mg, partial [Erythranthe guttata]
MKKVSKLQSQRNAWKFLGNTSPKRKSKLIPESTEKMMMMIPESTETTEKKLIPETTEKKNRNWNRRGFGAPSVWYDGVPTADNAFIIPKMKEAAQLAIDVYNDTHVKKYRFVELKRVTGQTITAIITFTAKPQEDDGEDDDNNLLIFRAR